ncbi:YdcF family protein [Actinotalea sp. M2MS4P-6]|uniref:SanA/YdcF family protein n=1 Tax=Actinotalea sp. M2MS4P-6 TaxID=2983762 RepID=UPI0021E4123E|nr:ElyC/SanA/YdcF family protein [Actinotalea sp. M2MS4P-6]MCV2393201.1 YdcF family protein [Actinotalea sp. M2MS4P-6]
MPANAPRRTRRWRTAVRWALGAAAVLALASVVWVQAVGQQAVVASPSDVPDGGVALVLGAGLRPDGSPSTYLRRRLDAAAALYDAGTVSTIVVSGDGVSRPGYDEPAAMRTWLEGLGVPGSAIVEDPEGVDTTASCRRATELGIADAVVITQDYHLRRALFSCRAAGLDAVGIGVSAQSVKPVQAVWWHAREVPASIKAAWDALLG